MLLHLSCRNPSYHKEHSQKNMNYQDLKLDDRIQRLFLYDWLTLSESISHFDNFIGAAKGKTSRTFIIAIVYIIIKQINTASLRKPSARTLILTTLLCIITIGVAQAYSLEGGKKGFTSGESGTWEILKG